MDKKISQLTSASTPLVGTELLAIVQSGQTLSTTTQDIADLAGGANYLVYSAFITYSGSFSVNILQNTLGTTLNWTNPSNGLFRATAASGTPFTVGKTVVVPGTFNNFGSPYFVTGSPFGPAATTTVNINLQLHDGTQTATPFVTNMFIEIRVYN